MGCPVRLAKNQSGECQIVGSTGYDVYAADFIMTRPSLDDIGYTRSKEDILVGVEYRDSVGCDESVSLEDCDLYTRHISAKSYNYSFMTASNELAYPDAVIVVETNKPIV